MVNIRKGAVIGCGFVGSACAFSLMQSGLFSELVLIDAERNKAEGEAMDISHGLPYARPMQIYAGNYDDVADCSVIIFTAGAAQREGESRLDLARKNISILRSVLPEIAGRGFEGILLVVANPVDVLTAAAVRLSGFPEQRVIGSGTVLDTARLKDALGHHLGVDSRDVNAFIVGEHGDSELAAWSCVDVGGVPLSAFCELRGHHCDHDRAAQKIYEEVKNSAYEIIAKKHATYYGVAMAVNRICESIIRDEHSILPVSSMIHGAYGVEGVALSLPAVVGSGGLETLVPIALSGEEQSELHRSARVLKEVLDSELPQ